MDVNEIIFNLEIPNHQKNIVKEQIQNFASAFNSVSIENVLSFYSQDAEFIPEGFKT